MLQTRKAFIWECGAEHQGRTDRYIVYPKDILINIDTREKYTSLNIDWDYGDMYLVFDDEMDNEISVELTKEFVDFDEIYAHKVVKENGEELEKGYVVTENTPFSFTNQVSHVIKDDKELGAFLSDYKGMGWDAKVDELVIKFGVDRKDFDMGVIQKGIERVNNRLNDYEMDM